MVMTFQNVDIFYKICYIFDVSSALACRAENNDFEKMYERPYTSYTLSN